MKNVIIFLVAFIISFTIQSNSQNILPHFSELTGMEDQQGNTNLFYRIYSKSYDSLSMSAVRDIRVFNTSTQVDSVYLFDGYWCNQLFGGGRAVYTFDIWNKNINSFIYAGELINCFEPYFFVSRFDSMGVYEDMFVQTQNLFISKQNDSLVFALPHLISYDGGFNWDTLNIEHNLVSVSPHNDFVYFSSDFTTSIPTVSVIFKSTDSGNSFAVVDTGGTEWSPIFYYDINENHIYRTYSSGYPNRTIKVSAQQGNAFTWQTIYSTNRDLYLTLDDSQTGTIYIAEGNRILKSADYGNSFSLYIQHDRNFVGIYKKPNSDKLYAATKYRIYEITNDSLKVIRSLPVPQNTLSYYPLKIGNKWVYNYSFYTTPVTGFEDRYIRSILSEEVKPNGKTYFIIEEKLLNLGITDTVYERIDSSEGKIFRYVEGCPGDEQLIDDLLMEIGDSTSATRYGYCLNNPPTIFYSDSSFTDWGISGRIRNLSNYDLFTAHYSLVSGIGLYSAQISDDNGEKHYNLKGCLIDGVIYGDTLTTSVEIENDIPKSFYLSQNYPNPFNPTTKLSWQLPVGSYLTIKVFDVLGREVATLVDEFKPAGKYDVEFNATELPSGVYFYQLNTGDFVSVKKMLLIK